MGSGPLEEKRIVLDPGHGFGVTGAIGHGGTREVEINIGVTRVLADLLREAGATVFLTWDEMTEENLARRVEISVSKQPDLFLSIHHNATAPPDPARNRIEVYYPFEGSVEVQDLASALAFALKDYSGLPVHPPLPARYRVLKGNVPLSILVEPAYVSHRAMEKRLRDPLYQAGEARALFEGIRHFFSQSPPRIEALTLAQEAPALELLIRASRPCALVCLETPSGTHAQVVETNQTVRIPIPAHFWAPGSWTVKVREPGGRAAVQSLLVEQNLPRAPSTPEPPQRPNKRVLLAVLSHNPLFEEVGFWVRESLRPLGIDVQVWPASKIPHDEVAWLRQAEAVEPDLILLLENQFRWPEGWYVYYRDVQSREIGERFAEASAFYGVPARLREGSTYFLIQGRPRRILFNGYVSVLPLASTLIHGIVETWWGSKPRTGEGVAPGALVRAKEGYFVFATTEGRYRLPYTEFPTAQGEGRSANPV